MTEKEIAKEAEAFAEREYEEGPTDRRSLAKGFYWGAKACAQWQKEQKPAWSEEDEMEIQRVIALLEGWLSTFIRYAEDCKCSIAWLKSIKQKIGGIECK